MSQNLETTGTISQENGLSVEEAEKIFNEAFTKVAPKSVTSVTFESETPVVENPIPEVEKKEETVAAPAAAEITKEQETTTSSKEEPKVATASTDPYAWLNNVVDSDLKNKILTEINARYDAEHRYKSANGRVNALRQEQLALHKRLAEQAQALNPASKQDHAQETPSTPKSVKEWDELIETDPALAKAVQAHLDSRVNELAQNIEKKFGTFKESTIDPLYDHQSKQYIEREAELLAQAVPNYLEVLSSPEWKAWLDEKPLPVQQAIRGSTNHQDALKAFRWYANDMVHLGWDKNSPFQQQQVHTQQQPLQSTVQQPAKGLAPSDQAEKLAKEREDKLKAAAVVSTSHPTPVASKPGNSGLTMEDAERIFNEAYNKSRPGAAR